VKVNWPLNSWVSGSTWNSTTLTSSCGVAKPGSGSCSTVPVQPPSPWASGTSTLPLPENDSSIGLACAAGARVNSGNTASVMVRSARASRDGKDMAGLRLEPVHTRPAGRRMRQTTNPHTTPRGCGGVVQQSGRSSAGFASAPPQGAYQPAPATRPPEEIP